jgi:hypothetical protein
MFALVFERIAKKVVCSWTWLWLMYLNQKSYRLKSDLIAHLHHIEIPQDVELQTSAEVSFI